MNNMRIHFAQTEACPHQGFVYNSHVLAMQFHMETDPDAVELPIEHCGQALSSGKYIQSKDQLRMGSRIFPESMYPLFFRLLTQWIETEESDETEYCFL